MHITPDELSGDSGDSGDVVPASPEAKMPASAATLHSAYA